MKDLHPEEAEIERQLEASLGRLSEANRPIVTRLVRKRRIAGILRSSNRTFVFALRHVDRAVKGKALDTLSPDDVEDCLAWLTEKLAPSSAFIAVRNLRRALTLLHPDGVLPPPMLRAIQMRRPRDVSGDRLIRDDEFHALLGAAANHHHKVTTFAPDMAVALLWTLWDSGFRAHELLSLRIESVSFEDDGTVILTIPKDAPLLKTGARQIPVAECVGPLKAWLSVHPAAGNPKAPLFCAFHDRTGLKCLAYKVMHKHVQLMARNAKVANPPALPDVSPHDFRHTCATRKARAGWVEPQLRLFFGWRPGSNMPSKYVHLALSDLRERVRRDYGLTNIGFPTAAPLTDSEMLVQLLRRVSGGQETARTTVPRKDAPQR